MKFIFLIVLLTLVACDGGNNQNTKVQVGSVGDTGNPGNISDQQYASTYINQTANTLPPELKINSVDKTYLQTEIDLTAEELETLNQL